MIIVNRHGIDLTDEQIKDALRDVPFRPLIIPSGAEVVILGGWRSGAYPFYGYE